MAFNPRSNRFTVYDVLEQKGFFASNPANADSADYAASGPVEYPKMMYHPEGAERIIEAEHKETTQQGLITIPQRTELISMVVRAEAEEKRLAGEGWHLHPADAMVAAGKPRPPVTPANRIAELEAQIRKLETQRAAAEKAA